MSDKAPATAVVKPIFRMFDVAKAREFYVDWLGFSWDWEHGGGRAPLYVEISRGALTLHLSEHHGDACPGSHIRVDMQGVEALHAEIMAKPYKYNRPGLEQMPWALEVTVIDPFGNRITFADPTREG